VVVDTSSPGEDERRKGGRDQDDNGGETPGLCAHLEDAREVFLREVVGDTPPELARERGARARGGGCGRAARGAEVGAELKGRVQGDFVRKLGEGRRRLRGLEGVVVAG
jgi:hypothetical protein